MLFMVIPESFRIMIILVSLYFYFTGSTYIKGDLDSLLRHYIASVFIATGICGPAFISIDSKLSSTGVSEVEMYASVYGIE